MLKHEIAEIVNSVDMYELAHKTVKGLALGDAETEAQKQLDQWAKYVGSTGHDPNREIAAFVERVVNDEIVQPPESILDYAFDRGMIGEFDAYEAYGAPKNTLIAYEAAPGGNVPRSFLDLSASEPKYVNLQVETDLDYADLRRNGWKTVARLTEYAVNALRFKQIAAVMSGIDALITSGADNYISETGATPSAASANALALYLLDRGSGYITDLGMCGDCTGILGVKSECVISGFVTGVHKRFEQSESLFAACGALFTLDTRTRFVTGVKRIRYCKDG